MPVVQEPALLASECTGDRSTRLLRNLLWAVVFTGIGIRVLHWLLAPSIWHDESTLLANVISFSAIELPFRRLDAYPATQAAPPLYLWTLKGLIALFGRSDLAMRLPAVFFGCLVLPIFARMMRRLAGLPCALLATAMLAFSDQVVIQCNQVKPYAIDVFVAVLIIWMGLVMIASQPRSIARLLLFGCVTSALTWLSFPSVFVIAVIGLLTLPAIWPGGWKPRIAWLLSVVLPALAFVLLYHYCIRRQHDAYLAQWWSDRFVPLAGPVTLAGWLWKWTYQSCVFACNPLGGLLLPLIVIGLLVWRRTNKPLFLLVGGCMALSLLAATVHVYPFGGTRVNLYLIPLQLAAAAAGISILATRPSRYRIWALPLLCAPVIAAFGMQLHRFHAGWNMGDVKAPIRYLQAQRQPGEHVVLFTSTTSCSYLWYEPHPDPLTQVDYQPGDPLPANSCWLVMAYPQAKKGLIVPSDAIPAGYHIIESRSFHTPGGAALWLEAN
jgi:4-amino-4-deoxy-L-arabinose transferase-like glycosyltransferase